MNPFELEVENAEHGVESAKKHLEEKKKLLARSEELWKLVSHLSSEELEMLHTVIRGKLGFDPDL